MPEKWFVVTGPDDPGDEFESWAEAREYLIALKNRDARILGPGCDPEGGDSLIGYVGYAKTGVGLGGHTTELIIVPPSGELRSSPPYPEEG